MDRPREKDNERAKRRIERDTGIYVDRTGKKSKYGKPRYYVLARFKQTTDQKNRMNLSGS